MVREIRDLTMTAQYIAAVFKCPKHVQNLVFNVKRFWYSKSVPPANSYDQGRHCMGALAGLAPFLHMTYDILLYLFPLKAL